MKLLFYKIILKYILSTITLKFHRISNIITIYLLNLPMYFNDRKTIKMVQKNRHLFDANKYYQHKQIVNQRMFLLTRDGAGSFARIATSHRSTLIENSCIYLAFAAWPSILWLRILFFTRLYKKTDKWGFQFSNYITVFAMYI